jgi:adenine-specific DNA-methyltransferase
VDGKSLDITQDKINQLRQLFPEVFTEKQIDWEKLKATLGEDINFEDERYVLNWAGKSNAFRVLQAPTTATLVPAREESINFDQTPHVFIEGENLEMLKVLQKAYYGKIKMIYIDPPYNTGNDHFIYPDKFSETKEEYLKRIGDKDELGYLTSEGLFRKNSKDSGHYHSNWLSMMYPRLFLARNLLRDDGVIFISIDDNEVHNLRLLMNEIFGEENFIDTIVWKKRYGGGAKEKFLVSLHEYILFYAKNIEELEKIFIPLDEDSVKKYYTHKDLNFETRGPYRTHPLEATRSVGKRENLIFPILSPDGKEIWPKRQWWWDKNRVEEALKRSELEFIKDKNDEWSIHTKQYLKDELGIQRKTKAFSIIDNVFTQHGAKEIERIFGDIRIYTFPKPSKLILALIQISNCKDGDIFLDFFAGSNSSAQALLEYNNLNETKCEFISIQLPEEIENDSEAKRQGFQNIADIAKERIRRIIKKTEETRQEKNQDLFSSEKTNLDLGFKVFKLQPSNFKIWWGDQLDTEVEIAEQLDAFVDPTNENINEENVLYELLLKSGFDLNSKIVNKGDFYLINDNDMALALAKIDEEIVKTIIAHQPKKVIALDKLFVNNDQLKTNTALQMKDAGIDFRTI